jgi:hypothetical protein
MPWAEQQMGYFSGEGWLLQNLTLTRYYRGAAVRDDPVRQAQYPDDKAPELTTLGQLEFRRWEAQRVDPEALVASLPEFTLTLDDLTGLEGLKVVQEQGYQVIVIEMPLPSEYQEYFDRSPRHDYQQFLDTLHRLEDQSDILVIYSHEVHLSEESWGPDYQHMSTIGAHTFSAWLGDQLAVRLDSSDNAN